MTMLKKFVVAGTTVALHENDTNLTIEINPKSNKNKEKIISYLYEEGFLEEIISGNTNWEEKP